MAAADPALIEAIRKIGFPDQPERHASALAEIASFTELPAGTLIFSEGEGHRQMYFICEGTVSLEMVTASCGRQRILTVGPRDLLAWSGLLGDGRMTSTAVVVEPVRLIEFNADELKSRCVADPEFGFVVMFRIAKALSRRLLATRLQLLDLYDDGEP